MSADASELTASFDPPPALAEPVYALRITPLVVALTIGALLMHRLWFASLRILTPDEALYWVWSKHLASGYLDHPPMIAYLIRLSTGVMGSTELGVRIFGVFMSFGASVTIMWVVLRLTSQRRAAFLAGAILLLNPLITVIGTIFTPDMPACFFSTIALAVLLLNAESDQRIAAWAWCAFGVLSGAALLSKYTAILPIIATGLALFGTRSGRAELARPWPYIAALIALIVFSPVIYWNATHDWASFLFQLDHGTTAGGRPNPAGILTFLGGQALAFSPILFILGIATLGIYWWKFRKLSRSQHLLLCNATLTLVVFAAASVRTRGELNWADYAYFPLTALMAQLISRKWSPSWTKWALIGCAFAGAEAFALQVPELWWKLEVPLPNKMEDAFQWDDMTDEVNEIRGNLPAIANRYQDAAELSFYDQSRPVWAISIGSRVTAYDYFDPKPDLASIPQLAWVGGHAEEFAAAYGYEIDKVIQATTTLPSERTRNRPVTLMHRQTTK
ncbi:MAG TPA: glycosyltransferase family 39 protein [Tepidisphaeraceae bacterium]|nr:glycosyltransferase family 39 protein [Tepidisphaeraceae bacterium]